MPAGGGGSKGRRAPREEEDEDGGGGNGEDWEHDGDFTDDDEMAGVGDQVTVGGMPTDTNPPAQLQPCFVMHASEQRSMATFHSTAIWVACRRPPFAAACHRTCHKCQAAQRTC